MTFISCCITNCFCISYFRSLFWLSTDKHKNEIHVQFWQFENISNIRKFQLESIDMHWILLVRIDDNKLDKINVWGLWIHCDLILLKYFDLKSRLTRMIVMRLIAYNLNIKIYIYFCKNVSVNCFNKTIIL